MNFICPDVYSKNNKNGWRDNPGKKFSLPGNDTQKFVGMGNLCGQKWGS